MKIKSALMTEASGSLGGLVASHNRGGLYLRARAVPVNPNTPQQQLIRGFVAQLTSLWTDVLTAPQRASWDLYAENVPLPDRLGEPRNVGGLAMYVRSNVPRMQSPLPRVDTAPLIFNLGDYSAPSFNTLSEATQDVTTVFSGTDEWVSETQAALIFYSSRAQNPSINYFKGPYRLADRILGSQPAPPVPPVQLSVAFPFVVGQRIFFRYNVTRADGRLGSEGFTTLIAENGPVSLESASRPGKKRNK